MTSRFHSLDYMEKKFREHCNLEEARDIKAYIKKRLTMRVVVRHVRVMEELLKNTKFLRIRLDFRNNEETRVVRRTYYGEWQLRYDWEDI